MRKITTFDVSEHHIYIVSYLIDAAGSPFAFRGIVDTGAPATEFSDEFLVSIGLIKPEFLQSVEIPDIHESRKYGRVMIPKIFCLGQVMENITAKIAKFADGWGIDALVGLDFFRRFRVTVDYNIGHIVTEQFA